MNSSFTEFLSHTSEAFGHDDSPLQRWETANALIGELGGTAVNIGAIQQDEIEPMWLLSSMCYTWRKKYVAERLFEIDPFIPMLKKKNTPIILDTRKRHKSQPLNDHLYKAGYKFLYGMPFQGTTASERKIVTYCTDLTLSEVKARGYLERIRFLAAILVTQVLPLDRTAVVPDQYFIKSILTARERECLQMLANGSRNQRIAGMLGIAEVTVRKHIVAARTKLGAMTREQAVAIALHHGFISIGITSDI